MLENLQPAPKIAAPSNYKPGVEFDGTNGTATTPGYETEPANFNEFLTDAGFNPDEIEVIPPIRTSRWQQREGGDWLTSYRFSFKRKTAFIDLPLVMAEAKRKAKPKPIAKPSDSCLVVLWSDLQVGKVDYRGNSVTLVQRVQEMQARLLDKIKTEKPAQVIFCDLGDTVEGFNNAAAMNQAVTNDLSIMQQVDLATTFAWQTLRAIAERVDKVTYASVGSNHCQWRMGKEQVGKPTDDWGVFIGRQLARLAHESGLTNISFLEPQEHDESLAIDVFGDGFHILGVVHGHQAKRPDQMATWWRGQTFGKQAVASATTLVHGHWHHLRITELGSTDSGASRFMVMASTLDNGSGWWRKVTGEDSIPGLVTFPLYKQQPFTGTVWKL